MNTSISDIFNINSQIKWLKKILKTKTTKNKNCSHTKKTNYTNCLVLPCQKNKNESISIMSIQNESNRSRGELVTNMEGVFFVSLTFHI